MSFVRRLSRIVPSFGTPLQNDTQLLAQNVAVTSGVAIVLPNAASGGLTAFSPTIAAGYVRVRVYGGASGVTLSNITVSGSDAPGSGSPLVVTNVAMEEYAPTPAQSVASPAGGPNGVVDVICPFLSDRNLTSISVTITSSAACIADIEVAGASGDF